ncbi:MAG: trimeric intracellular cation channel family protein [Clostridiales bacterium]|jgi:uncharacterized membrane protein YeiH|nr:trimeric intracellular cation channel family protein [Clostridiales bacterium]
MWLTERVFYILEIVGTIAFAVSGAMIAIERRLDLFGVVFLGVITAVGGGMIRDILIGSFPPVMFINMEYVLTACAVSIAVFLVAYFASHTYFKKASFIDTVNNVFDAVGLGAFSVTGTRIGISAGYSDNMFLCVFLGMLTGIGGGLLRDMMSRSIPFVLRKRIYALAAIAGACLYYLLFRIKAADTIAIFSAVGLTCIIRILATAFEWNLPVAAPEKEIVRTKK